MQSTTSHGGQIRIDISSEEDDADLRIEEEEEDDEIIQIGPYSSSTCASSLPITTTTTTTMSPSPVSLNGKPRFIKSKAHIANRLCQIMVNPLIPSSSSSDSSSSVSRKKMIVAPPSSPMNAVSPSDTGPTHVIVSQETASRPPSASTIKSHPCPMDRDHSQIMRAIRRNRRATMALLNVTILFAVSWLPWNAFNLWLDFADVKSVKLDSRTLYLIFSICHLIAMTSATSNSIMYGWLNTNIRKELNNLAHSAADKWTRLVDRCCSACCPRHNQSSISSADTAIISSTSSSHHHHHLHHHQHDHRDPHDDDDDDQQANNSKDDAGGGLTTRPEADNVLLRINETTREDGNAIGSD